MNMERKVLVCMVSVLVFILSGIVQGADLDCQKLHNKYRMCVEKKDLGRNLDFKECQGYGDKDTCQINKCFWDTKKNRCYLDICLNDVMNDTGTGSEGMVTTPDFSVEKWEFGRQDCPTTPDVPAPAPVPKTGQITCYDSVGNVRDCDGTGEDGEYQKGVETTPRFTDRGNGTVTDNLTGLMWTKDAQQIPGQMTWQAALDACNNLDYAGHGDWRLPNLRELQSLIDYGNMVPVLPSGHPFTNESYGYNYWSSTTMADSTGIAWYFDFTNGGLYGGGKSYYGGYVRAVRAGQ
jgi:hypothetical protein